MKKIFIISLAYLSIVNYYGQVGIGTVNPISSSVLDITSTNKGVIIPQVQLTSIKDKSPLAGNIPNGTMVFNTIKSNMGINAVIPGIYVWYNNEWVFPSEIGAVKAKVVKYTNSASTVTNFNPDTVDKPANIDIFSTEVYNDDPTIFKKLNDFQIRLEEAGLYLVSVNLALKQNTPTNKSLLYDYIHFNLDGVMASSNISTMVPQNDPSKVDIKGRFAYGFTSYITATAARQVLTLQSTRGQDGAKYNGIISFDNVSLSSVSIIKLR
ncbi:hypothetical protein [Chryseobacterium sp.]|uniref:hypothetical protein n=1 Tax=Chryseobacterium sp. TaxID=1871047 RepID=UPI0028A1395D|nr:hypothetical protein [Chryseobacterium sp.]